MFKLVVCVEAYDLYICIGKYISIQEQIVFSLLSDRNMSVLPFLKWQCIFTFNVDICLSSITAKAFTWLYIWVTLRGSYRKQELLILGENIGLALVFDGVCVAAFFVLCILFCLPPVCIFWMWNIHSSLPFLLPLTVIRYRFWFKVVYCLTIISYEGLAYYPIFW